jgi:hypothetical protein
LTRHAQTNLLTLVASKAKARRFHEVPARLSGFGPLFDDELEAAEVERAERQTVERHIDEREQEQWA